MAVALTFDDGPDPVWTPRVLDTLDAVAAPATFFVVAEQIESPDGVELLAETLRRGHAVQMHCARHLRHESLELAELRADAEAIEAVLAAHGAPGPVFWRPPYGSVHPLHSCRVAAERGRRLVRWSYDTVDYRGRSAAEMLEQVRRAPMPADAVVLMHDSRRYSSTPEGGAAGTAELIGPLVEHVRSRGWELETLDGSFERRAADRYLLPCAPPGASRAR